MDTNGEVFRTHSHYIRDTLAPLVASSGKSALNDRDISIIRSTLADLNSVIMTLDLLRYSRIEKALNMIVVGDGWPLEVVMQAEELYTRWELALGPLRNLYADLWAQGGRMEGIRIVHRVEKSVQVGNEIQIAQRRFEDGHAHFKQEDESCWSVDPPPDPSRSHRYGHLNFDVGAWWINPVAAFRDGIVDGTGHSITAGPHGAYAIILKDSQETVVETHGLLKYHASPKDPGVFKLMKTMGSNERESVRVLRSYKLNSPIAPVAGLRYDGLYDLTSYGVLLPRNPRGRKPSTSPSPWSYTFSLRRHPNQEPLEKSLAHPIAEELDDWSTYQRVTATQKARASLSIERFAAERKERAFVKEIERERGEGGGRWGGVMSLSEMMGEREGSGDSGYFT